MWRLNINGNGSKMGNKSRLICLLQAEVTVSGMKRQINRRSVRVDAEKCVIDYREVPACAVVKTEKAYVGRSVTSYVADKKTGVICVHVKNFI